MVSGVIKLQKIQFLDMEDFQENQVDSRKREAKNFRYILWILINH